MLAMPFSSDIGDEAEIEAASSNGYNSSGPLWTVPELFFEDRTPLGCKRGNN